MPNKNHQLGPLQRWRDEHEVVLNKTQRAAISWYFSPDNTEGEPWTLAVSIAIGVDNGQLVINGLYLDSDGEWCTFPTDSAGNPLA